MPRIARFDWAPARLRLLQRRAGEHICCQFRGSRQPAFALAVVGLEQGALEELAHDSERKALLELGRARVEDSDPRR